MKLPQLSLRELFLLVALAAMGCGWWVSAKEAALWKWRAETLKFHIEARTKRNSSVLMGRKYMRVNHSDVGYCYENGVVPVLAPDERGYRYDSGMTGKNFPHEENNADGSNSLH